jgi:hypothetical protein
MVLFMQNEETQVIPFSKLLSTVLYTEVPELNCADTSAVASE